MMYCIYSSVSLAEETRDKSLLSQVAHFSTYHCVWLRRQDLVYLSCTGDRRLLASKGSHSCLPGWVGRSWCTVLIQSRHWAPGTGATLLVCLAKNARPCMLIHSRQKAVYVCLVEKAGAGILLLHSRQDVHDWLRRQELVYFSFTADKSLMSQVAHLPVCLIEKAGAGVLLLHSRQKPHVTGGSLTCLPDWEGRSWDISPLKLTRGSCHRWLTYLFAWLRRKELVYCSSTADKRFMSQVTHFPVCLVEKEEAEDFSFTADKRLMSQVAHLPVCLVQKEGAGVLLLHSRQEVHVTGDSLTCLPGWEGRGGGLLLHSRQEVHVTGDSLTCLPGWEGRSWCTAPSQLTRGSCHRWAQLPVCLVEKTGAGVPLLHSRQAAHVTGGLVTCLPGWEFNNWCTSPPQQTRGSCHRWLSYLSAWFRRQELVYFSSIVDKRVMPQVAHLPVCLVEKARTGVWLLHSRQEVHVTGELSYLSAWLRRQELVYFSSTVDRRLLVTIGDFFLPFLPQINFLAQCV
jgi:hypothetical protein